MAQVLVPTQVQNNNVLGVGLSGWVHRLDAVVKSYNTDNAEEQATEVAVYTRLGNSHENILRYYGLLEDSVLLQFAQHGTLRQCLRQRDRRPFSCTKKIGWAQQITSAIAFLHSKGIYHCDISCNNIFIDRDLNALVGDFAGSSIDGSAPAAWYEVSHSIPGADQPSAKTELFAFGSTLYEMVTEQKPFGKTDECQIEVAITDGHFPDLSYLPILATPITRCWNQQYESVQDLLDDIETEASSYAQSLELEAKGRRMPPLASFGVLVIFPLLWWAKAARLYRDR